MTSRELPQRIVLHIGAHKTATTHLQQSIVAAGQQDGFAFLGPRQLRGAGKGLPERFGFPLYPSDGQAASQSVRDMLCDLANGARRLVFSDENFAGRLQTGWGRIPTPLYFTAPKRITMLASAIADAGGPPLDLCLGIRDPAQYLTSCYSQILHGRRVVKPEKFREKNPLTIVDWVDYVARLRDVRGVGTLTVWRCEDYTALFPQICMTMLGTDQVKPIAGRVQQRLSAKALAAVLQAKADDQSNNVATAAAAFPVTDRHPAFELYDQATRDRAAAHFAGQWDALRGRAGVTTLSAGNA